MNRPLSNRFHLFFIILQLIILDTQQRVPRRIVIQTYFMQRPTSSMIQYSAHVSHNIRVTHYLRRASCPNVGVSRLFRTHHMYTAPSDVRKFLLRLSALFYRRRVIRGGFIGIVIASFDTTYEQNEKHSKTRVYLL